MAKYAVFLRARLGSRDQQLHYGSGKIYVANILLNSGERTQQTTPCLLDSFSRIRLEYIKTLKRYCHKSCKNTDAYSLSLSIKLFYFWLLFSKLDAEIRSNVFKYKFFEVCKSIYGFAISDNIQILLLIQYGQLKKKIADLAPHFARYLQPWEWDDYYML
jgi:hypothetical protein